MSEMTGRCLCGAISYAFDGEPMMTAICHCDDCQRQSGAAFSVNVVVDRAELSVTGEPKVFNTTGEDTGELRDRMFCGECGSVLFSVLREADDMMIIKAGTLDDKSGVLPEMELWTERAQGWRGGEEERGEFPRGIPT